MNLLETLHSPTGLHVGGFLKARNCSNTRSYVDLDYNRVQLVVVSRFYMVIPSALSSISAVVPYGSFARPGGMSSILKHAPHPVANRESFEAANTYLMVLCVLVHYESAMDSIGLSHADTVLYIGLPNSSTHTGVYWSSSLIGNTNLDVDQGNYGIVILSIYGMNAS
jgi:hypothetical protein